jgi:hypothetical protein
MPPISGVVYEDAKRESESYAFEIRITGLDWISVKWYGAVIMMARAISERYRPFPRFFV